MAEVHLNNFVTLLWLELARSVWPDLKFIFSLHGFSTKNFGPKIEQIGQSTFKIVPNTK